MADSQSESAERDHVDRFLASAFLEDIPNLDLEVEGIVDRINGLARRFKQSLGETLEQFGLSYGEWNLLGALRRAGPPYRRSPGKLAAQLDLSTGAMTNRLDRLEQAGLVRRLPDPADRRGIQVELTAAGQRVWNESAGAAALKEALVAAGLNEGQKKELNALLRKLMIVFEEKEGKKGPKD
jgi:DNA-binding MarR family transcriptional regulator